MLAHRKRCLTLLREPEVAPSVGFPALPRRRERLEMSHIAGASAPIGRAGKPISVNPNRVDML